MKKKLSVISLIPAAFSCIALSGCGTRVTKYELNVIDNNVLLRTPLEDSYAAGDLVTVEINTLLDYNVYAKLDGSYVSDLTKGDGYYYFTFTMPETETEVEVGLIERWSPKVTHTYTVGTEGKADILLNGTEIFFDLETYGISDLVGGDSIVVEYVGEFLIEETLPSRFAGDIDIFSVTQTKTAIAELTYSDLSHYTGTYESTSYVILEDMSFVSVEDYASENPDATLYAGLGTEENSTTIYGLYASSPR